MHSCTMASVARPLLGAASTIVSLGCALFVTASCAIAQTPQESDFAIPNFRFANGEQLPKLNLHVTTLGHPARNNHGQVSNAVLILHGTGGSGKQFLSPQFRDVLFRPGGLLDASKYFIILPDDIGHGKSSKPSDGLRSHFPHYGYADMVNAEYRLVTEGLKVNHLRLVMGTSMGCMHTWMWGERNPDFMDALMPLACLPIPISGRNRIWRKMLMDSIQTDPQWNNGDYRSQPPGLTSAIYLLIIAGSSPLQMQKAAPTPEFADKYLAARVAAYRKIEDANDLLYAVASSRDYDPSRDLEKIQAPVMYINSADDFINPPELGIAQREIKRVKRGRFVLLPITDETRGHGTHTQAKVWRQYLQQLLDESSRR
ncbi:MAG TPA: alpha/beta fold hydrolase [Bryobacteraceae bacterium]|nr:alpha/beta fold hydrolase [Bryobacteraceae bacterium]